MTILTNLDSNAPDHWAAHARQWSHIGSPLRPHSQDIAAIRALLTRHLSSAADSTTQTDTRSGENASSGLLLGVTPELTQLYPRIVAVDRDRGMLDMLRDSAAILPNTIGNSALQANWLSLPFAKHTLAFALGDGSFNLLRYPQDYHALFEQLHIVLQPAAPLILRIFIAPLHGESCAGVIAAAYAGAIANFHAFKWRFAMALVTRNRNPNIGVADIHREFSAWVPKRAELAHSTGWPLSSIETIDVYRNSPAVYSFPSAEEWSVIAARYGAECERLHGTYELAERCPIICHRLYA